MSQTEQRKNKVWVPIGVSLILLFGFGLGVATQKYLINTKPLDKFLDREDPIDEIITLITNEYVDTISKDSLYLDAVNGILSHLDPHTVYIPTSQLIQANQVLQGGGKGIGIEYFYLKDTMLITGISMNGPAYRAGLKIGDKIIKVNNKDISGVNIDEKEAVKLFSESDTLALVVMHTNKRMNNNLKIVKGEISSNSIAYSTLLPDNKTGYIKLSIFSSTSYDATMEAIENLLNKGMTQLILDVRDNGGGYLEEATNIADEFIDGKKLLLSVNGKRDGKFDYKASNKGIFEEGNLIILIDGNSASASEILAGAIQDWDRGIIIGTNSYGKGLVQEQFDLSDGSAIRLTTGKYYTPTGRSIQRTYNKGKQEYNQAYFDRLKEGNKQLSNQGKIYYTLLNKRPIYEDGGIYPDVVSDRGFRIHSAELANMIDNYYLDGFVNTYYFTDFKQNHAFESYEEFEKKYIVSSSVISMLREYFLKNDAIYTERIWKNEEDLKYLRIKIKAMIAKLHFGIDGYYQSLLNNDQTYKKAYEIINSEQYNTILQSHNTH